MIRTRFVPILLLPALMGGLRAAPPALEFAVMTVRLYNLAETPNADVARATQRASDIFSGVGIRLRLDWLRCAGVPEPECFRGSGPDVVNLRLMPERMQPPEGLRDGVLGFALIPEEGGAASFANVYVERVAAIADGRKYRFDSILGAAIAHELGHLLLGRNSHSKIGLMRFPWGPEALTDADRGMLGFSKREAARIRGAAQARAAATVTAVRRTR